MNDCKEKYYGKYRGTVVNNVDPKRQGRIQVSVTDVGIVLSNWAMPCVPIAGIQSGIFTIPAIGTGVWVEFEQGDTDYPIWTGCWWGTPIEAPPTAQAAPPALPIVILETTAKNGFVISDTPVPVVPPLPIGLPAGGIIIRSGTSYVRVDAKGVSIYGPTVTINSTSMVDINSTALTVTGPGTPV